MKIEFKKIIYMVYYDFEYNDTIDDIYICAFLSEQEAIDYIIQNKDNKPTNNLDIGSYSYIELYLIINKEVK